MKKPDMGRESPNFQSTCSRREYLKNVQVLIKKGYEIAGLVSEEKRILIDSSVCRYSR